MVPSEIREENKRNKLQLKKIIKQSVINNDIITMSNNCSIINNRENNLQTQRIKV